MKVLVAGLAKTGTKSMCAALTLLGYEVYDWMENFYYLGDDWQKQVKEGFKVEDMRRMYENVDAVMDGPCDVYWEEIFDAFPDVKVILTTRDEESWLKSVKTQVDQLNGDTGYRIARTITYSGIRAHNHLALTAHHLAKVWTWPYSTLTMLNVESLKRVRLRHDRNVKQIVPEEQLLVYQVKDGWGPLCDFLGIPVPDLPFPHKNKGGNALNEMRKENPIMQQIERELKISLGCLFAIVAFGIYKSVKYFR